MNKEIKHNSIKDLVLNKIMDDKIKSHPKSFFVLRNTLLLLSVFIVLSFIILLVSFIFFTIQSSRLFDLTSFGSNDHAPESISFWVSRHAFK